MNIKFISTHIESGEKYHYENDGKINYKDIVLPPNQQFVLKIDYPLTESAIFKFNSSHKGITRHQLSEKIRKCYKKVYEDEDKSVGHKTSHIKGMLNRDFSDGKYGIWGHDIGDLVLVNADISKKNVITLCVDS